ncbi:MAG: dynamin family protein [Myxococcota bacterium]
MSFLAKKEEALEGLRNLATLAYGAGAVSLARSLREDRIPRLEEERFHLVVLGEFNHGKTTFVNALLGAPVLPMGVTPTTAVIHTIAHGETSTAKAVLEEGERDVPFEEVERYEVDGGANAEGVRHLHVTYPSQFLEGGVVLVDTPGVNDLNEARAEITYEYIPRSDAVLFLLDAGQILKESERQFVANKLLAQSRDKLIFVVNKMDLLDSDEQQEALAYARLNLGKLMESPRVYGVSAEQALGGEYTASGMEALASDLQSFLREERGRMILDNALGEGLRVAETLRTGIEVQRRALTMEHGELERRLHSLEADLEGSEQRIVERTARIRESLSAVRAVIRADVEGFGERFAEQLPGEIAQSDAKDLRQYLQGFIEERFRRFAEEEAQEVARRLEQVTEEAIAFVTDEAAARAEKLGEALGEGAPELDLDVSTLAYDVGVFAVGAFGVTLMMLSNVVVGGALTLAAPVLAMVARGRTDKAVKERAAEEAPALVREAAKKMADAFDTRIDEFGARLIEFVENAGAEMTRSFAELVRAARSARQQGEDSLERFAGATDEQLESLKVAGEGLTSLRASLRDA